MIRNINLNYSILILVFKKAGFNYVLLHCISEKNIIKKSDKIILVKVE